jgi:hypothetical protein
VVAVDKGDGNVVMEGRGRKAGHLVKVPYKTKKGEEKVKDSITFNPFLKTKLLGVLAPSFMMQPADKCVYRRIYDDYKHRLENHKIHKDKSKGHRDNMAKRYMIKQFLKDLYKVWRQMETCEVHDPYENAKLGMDHDKRKGFQRPTVKAG